MSNVAVSRVHFPVTTLGPGRRVGIWLQGCSIRCPGCISLDTWDPGQGVIPLEELLASITELAACADGLTISGGEPFDQPEALAAIVARWREVSSTTALAFTGYDLETVSAWLNKNSGMLDALVVGPFRSDLPQTLALRGSDNQRIHALTAAGREFLAYDRPMDAGDRRLDVMFEEDGSAWFAGIPGRGEMGRLRRTLAQAGHTAVMSDTFAGVSG